jgi:hypothetical protein
MLYNLKTINKPGMSQGLLISNAGSLNNFSESVEDLTGDSDGLEEVGLSGRIDDLLPGVVPVEVHHRLLKPQQVVDGADDQVDGRRVARLRT